MIPLGPVTSSAGTTYSMAQVVGMLVQPSLQMRWFFDLLGPQLLYKLDLTDKIDRGQPPTISYDSTRAVKRQLTFKMRAISGVNSLQDLVRVRYQMLAQDGGWLEWQIGLFMLTPPRKEIHEGYTWWSVTAPDLSQLLSDASVNVATSVQAGTKYSVAVGSAVLSYGGLTPLSVAVPDTGQVLPASLNWDAGTSYLKIVNDLLGAINYTPGFMRGNTLVSQAQPDYNTVLPWVNFDTISGGLWVIGPLQDEPNYANAYNQFLVRGQDPRRQPVSAYYENTRADSPVSLRNWHPRLKVVNDSTLPDEVTCRARALSEAQLAARIYSVLTVGTVPFPWFEDLDVIELSYTSADEGQVHSKFVVVGGTHTCAVTPTSGRLQRIIAA